MPRVTSPSTTIVKVVPRDGTLEVTLNININVDGKVAASSRDADAEVEYCEPIIPQFKSASKLQNFAK
jgi:hypothetical protein